MALSEMLSSLKTLQLRQRAYAQACGCLSFDAATAAPPAAAGPRGVTLSFLNEQSYALLVNDDTRALLDGLWARQSELDLPTRRQVELMRDELDEFTRIPADEYSAYSLIINEAAEKWRAAKAADDFSLFAPSLEKVVDYARRFAAYRDPNRPAYDVMLDQYEKGMDTATLDPLFSMLREKIAPLVEGARTREARPAFADALCPLEAQRKLSAMLMDLMGIDRERCTLSETEHPFTQGYSRYDVRITTHYYPNAFFSSMYSVMHEGGHALYELGMADEYQFTCLADATAGMHESQSRFYENLVGHNEGFLRFLAPRLHECFPDALRGVSDEQLIRAANWVQPSLVRVEADQVTYPLHIMIRYELEKQLIGGMLKVRDLPAAWNAMYRDYLGIEAPGDALGVLQDMHWSEGMFGYFPTYALGGAYASQFMHAMRADLDVDALLSCGDLAPITAWLQARVHRHGLLYPPVEWLKQATGEPFNPAYYADDLSRFAAR